MKIRICFDSEKISNLYLMKIHISFYMQKNFRSVFNENTNLFLLLFFFLKKIINAFSSLLQILKFKKELNLKPKHVNQLLNNKLNMWAWHKKIWTRLCQSMNKIKHNQNQIGNKPKSEIRDILAWIYHSMKEFFRNQRSLTSLKSKICSLKGKKFLKPRLPKRL